MQLDSTIFNNRLIGSLYARIGNEDVNIRQIRYHREITAAHFGRVEDHNHFFLAA